MAVTGQSTETASSDNMNNLFSNLGQDVNADNQPAPQDPPADQQDNNTPDPSTGSGGSDPQNPDPNNNADQDADQGDQGNEPDFVAMWNPFFEATGYKGEIESITSAADVITIVNDMKARHDAEMQGALGDHKELVDYLKQGGDLDLYKSLPQPSVYWEDKEIKEDQVALAEQFLNDHYAQNNWKPVAIKATIDDLKETGELMNEAQTVLQQYKDQEKTANDTIIASNKSVLDGQIAEMRKFEADVLSVYSKPMNGVTAAKELVEQAKIASALTKEGEIPIIETMNGMNAQQAAVMYIAALAISSGKAFKYEPTRQATTAKATDTMFGKSSGGSGKSGKIENADLSDLGKWASEHRATN